MKSIRIADHIYDLAQQEAALMSRSIAQQLEHWAQLGAALESAGVTQDHMRSILGGKAHFPHEKALTALMGQVTKDLPGNDYISIDVMFRLYGDITTEAVRARAVAVELDGVAFTVMHPMDVLQSRLENVHGIAEKQDEAGTR